MAGHVRNCPVAESGGESSRSRSFSVNSRQPGTRQMNLSRGTINHRKRAEDRIITLATRKATSNSPSRSRIVRFLRQQKRIQPDNDGRMYRLSGPKGRRFKSCHLDQKVGRFA